MTVVSLSMPKQKICSACQDEPAMLRLHVPAVKGLCLERHHRHTDQKMLLSKNELYFLVRE